MEIKKFLVKQKRMNQENGVIPNDHENKFKVIILFSYIYPISFILFFI